MTDPNLAARWETTHRERGDDVSWFESVPTTSLELIGLAGLGPDDPVVDVGGGASTLVDELLALGQRDVTVLDLSRAALDRAAARCGSTSATHWIVGDVRSWEPSRHYALWHDRAAFHFLTEATDRRAYLERLDRAVPQGWIVMATFAPDGPTSCSGLPVQRWSTDDLTTLLTDELGGSEPVATRTSVHVTPWDAEQPFSYVLVRRS